MASEAESAFAVVDEYPIEIIFYYVVVLPLDVHSHPLK